MKNLSEKISELLYEYDCVIIPELGGFVTNYKPAHINEDTQVIFPPSKALGFNGNLTNNDGLLANHISSSENISFEEANSNLKIEVENCFEKLNAGNRVVFEKVGILYLDEESSIQFEPDHSVNYLTSSFGMYEFHCPEKKEKGIEKEIIQEDVVETKVIQLPKKEEKVQETPIIEMETKQEQIEKPRKTKYWAAAVLIPLFAYAGLVTYNSDVINDHSIHVSDLNPFKAFQKNNYEERSVESSLEPADELFVNIVTEIQESEIEKEEEATIIEESSIVEEETKIDAPASVIESVYADENISNYPFHIINGCFGVQANAEKHTKRLRNKGFKANIIDKKGSLYRVSQGSFMKEEEALQLLRKLKNSSAPDAWILKK